MADVAAKESQPPANLPEDMVKLREGIVSGILAMAGARAGEGDDLPWEDIGEKNGCKMYRADVPGSKFFVFKGHCVVEAPPDEVWAMIRIQENLKVIDPMCMSVDSVHLWDNDHRIVHATFKMPPMIWNRDFVYFAVQWSGEEGFVSAGQSVDWEDTPKQKDFERGTIMQSGYFVQRIDGEPNKCTVTYITQASPGGWLPAWVVNLVAKSQAYNPGIIQEKREMIRESYADRQKEEGK